LGKRISEVMTVAFGDRDLHGQVWRVLARVALAVPVMVALGVGSGSSAMGRGRAAVEKAPPPARIVRELTALRTAYSDTFLRSDGLRLLKIYTRPVNYRAGNGSWAPIASSGSISGVKPLAFPATSFSEETDCTIESEREANKSLCGNPLAVGADSEKPKDVSRSLLHFELDTIPTDAAILQTRLSLFLTKATASPIEIEAYGLTRAFTKSATWKTHNGTSSWTMAGGDYGSLLDGKATVTKAQLNERVGVGISPEVEQWVRTPSSNDGILLKTSKERTSGVDTFDQGGSKEAPVLEVTYQPVLGSLPGQPMVSMQAEEDTFAVNVADGDLHITAPDVRFQGKGYETLLSRSYNSQDENIVGTAYGITLASEHGA
jgi:hypothetical protein